MMTDGGRYFTPDITRALLTGFGTALFSQHCPLGPCPPGRTQLQAEHAALPAHACWQAFHESIGP
jgi:hypothetical protein